MIDIGLAPGLPREPFKRLFTQGMIRLDGSKMSKSKGNLIAPEQYFQSVGADGLRLFHLFVGPPADNVDWNDQTDELIEGCARFIDRVYRLAYYDEMNFHEDINDSDLAARQAVHRTIERVTQGLERWSFNTSVAALMELVNTISKWSRSEHGAERTTLDEAIDTVLRLLAPMTPHITAELWESRHPGEVSVHLTPWPVADAALLVRETETMVVQVNGKVRARVDVEVDISEDAASELALALPAIRAAVGDRVPQRVIARPPRLVNIVL
jgi:leucyl-tRNA synthetase